MNRYIRLIYVLSNKFNILNFLNALGYSFNFNGEVITEHLNNKYIKNKVCLSLNDGINIREIFISYYLPNYQLIEVNGYLIGQENFRHSIYRKIFEVTGGIICEFNGNENFEVVNLKSKQCISKKGKENIEFLKTMLELGYSYDEAVNSSIFCTYEFKEKIFLELNKKLNRRVYYIIAGI
ncbi:TPA: hypothetical protein N2D99_001998 [Clostridium botulinum]|nr:hypothetical protein [Clostridium botulinum]